jgi:hypothetical protein
MLRDLATLLGDLHAGLSPDWPVRAGVALRAIDMTLPIDAVAIFRDGGCVLLADVARTSSDADWYTQRSQLSVVWETRPAGERAR